MSAYSGSSPSLREHISAKRGGRWAQLRGLQPRNDWRPEGGPVRRLAIRSGISAALGISALTTLTACGHISSGPVKDERSAIAVAVRACNRDAWSAGIDAAKWEWHATFYGGAKAGWKAWIGTDESKRPVEVNIPAEGAPEIQCAFLGNEGLKLLKLPPR